MENCIRVREDMRRDGICMNFLLGAKEILLLSKTIPYSTINVGYPAICNEEKRNKYGFAWGTPGGKLEFGEYSIDGAIREVQEEIGIELKKSALKLLEVKELPHFTDTFHGFAFKYGVILDEKAKIAINGESDDCKWFDINNLPEDRIKEDDIFSMTKIAKEKLGK